MNKWLNMSNSILNPFIITSIYLFEGVLFRETFKTKHIVFDDILMETTQVCGVKLVGTDKRYMRQCLYSPALSFVLETKLVSWMRLFTSKHAASAPTIQSPLLIRHWNTPHLQHVSSHRIQSDWNKNVVCDGSATVIKRRADVHVFLCRPLHTPL